MDYIVAFPNRELLEALCAFADHLATLPDPRDPRGVRHALPVLLATLLVALTGGATGGCRHEDDLKELRLYAIDRGGCGEEEHRIPPLSPTRTSSTLTLAHACTWKHNPRARPRPAGLCGHVVRRQHG